MAQFIIDYTPQFNINQRVYVAKDDKIILTSIVAHIISSPYYTITKDGLQFVDNTITANSVKYLVKYDKLVLDRTNIFSTEAEARNSLKLERFI